MDFMSYFVLFILMLFGFIFFQQHLVGKKKEKMETRLNGLLQYLLQLFATGMDHCLHYHVSSRINLWTKRSRILVLFLVRKVN